MAEVTSSIDGTLTVLVLTAGEVADLFAILEEQQVADRLPSSLWEVYSSL